MKVKIVKLNNDATIPVYKTSGAAGCDVTSCENTVIKAGSTGIVGTGIALEIPEDVYYTVYGRSGLAFKYNVWAFLGLIDSDYRGEVKVLLENKSNTDFEVKIGDRIAQLVFTKYKEAEFEQVEFLSETDRGAGGFGSTGS